MSSDVLPQRGSLMSSFRSGPSSFHPTKNQPEVLLTKVVLNTSGVMAFVDVRAFGLWTSTKKHLARLSFMSTDLICLVRF